MPPIKPVKGLTTVHGTETSRQEDRQTDRFTLDFRLWLFSVHDDSPTKFIHFQFRRQIILVSFHLIDRHDTDDDATDRHRITIIVSHSVPDEERLISAFP